MPVSTVRKIRCTVAVIVNHGGGVYTVDLAPCSPMPSFRPGQFLHLTVDDYDPSGFWPESRVFSIASSPEDRNHVRICYSVKGRYTARMQQVLKVGGTVWIKLPYGDFVIDEACDAVLIAGGTGISAFTAFLGGLSPAVGGNVTVAYGARNPDLLLHRDLLHGLCARCPGFDLIYFVEQQPDVLALELAALPRRPRCIGGQISIDHVLRPAAGDRPSSTAIYYLSGPPAMIKALGTGLRDRGVRPDNVRVDAWE